MTKKYKAISSGLICRLGTKEIKVKAEQVYEWGPEEARLYLSNAPDNFIEIEPEPKPKPAKSPGGKK